MQTKSASAMLMATLAASLLAAAAAVLVIDASSARASASEGINLIRAEHRARGLLELAIVRLDDEEGATAQGILFEEGDGARVVRQDVSGLVDVNAAAPELLARLFIGAGAAPEDAVTLADRIADWRDEDSLRRLHGAEAADYVRATLPPPRNRPFETEGELAFVLGMPPDLIDCLSPYLTTYSGLASVNLAHASPQLAGLLHVSTDPPTTTPPGSVVILRAEAPISEHAVLRRSIWLRLTKDPNRPFLIHRAAQQLAPADEAPMRCSGETHE